MVTCWVYGICYILKTNFPHQWFCIYALGDSDSEETDSDISDVGSVDSDLANEQELTYKRAIYREDLPELRKKLKEKTNVEQAGTGLSANRAAAAGKKQAAPECSITMQFVHGWDFSVLKY